MQSASTILSIFEPSSKFPAKNRTNREKSWVKFWQILLITIALLASLNLSLAATQTALKKYNIGYTVVSEYAPLWIARDAGFFNAQGLDVQTVFLRGGTLSLQALVAGDIHFIGASGPTLIEGNLRGMQTMIIATLINRFPHTLFASPQIKSILQLKGKKIAVNSLTGSAMFATKTSLKKFGLDPDKDVAYIAGGSPDSRLALLKVGVVDATVLVPPETLAAKKLGFNMLLDMSDFRFSLSIIRDRSSQTIYPEQSRNGKFGNESSCTSHTLSENK